MTMHGGSVTYKGRYLKVRRWSAGFWWTGPHNSALTMHSFYWLELSLQIAENWRPRISCSCHTEVLEIPCVRVLASVLYLLFANQAQSTNKKHSVEARIL